VRLIRGSRRCSMKKTLNPGSSNANQGQMATIRCERGWGLGVHRWVHSLIFPILKCETSECTQINQQEGYVLNCWCMGGFFCMERASINSMAQPNLAGHQFRYTRWQFSTIVTWAPLRSKGMNNFITRFRDEIT
jgi:hypothetical protein